MTEARNEIIAQMRADAEQLNNQLTQIKCDILAELDIQCAGQVNLSSDYYCQDTDWYHKDTYGDGCSWYDNNVASCGVYDTENFKAWEQCCGCGGGDYYWNNLQETGDDIAVSIFEDRMHDWNLPEPTDDPNVTPEWEFDLDYDQADQYIAELEASYEQYHTDMYNLFSEWAEAKQTIDNYYWNYEMMPLFEEKQRLDERTMRTIITWLVDGTQVKGQPLVDVFPGVEQYMLDNYNAYGVSLADKFGLNGSPLAL